MTNFVRRWYACIPECAMVLFGKAEVGELWRSNGLDWRIGFFACDRAAESQPKVCAPVG